MSLSIQECIRKVKQAYPDFQPYAYVEFHGCYIFNLIEAGHDPNTAIAEFHIVSPEDGIVSGNIPTLQLYQNSEFFEKWKNANLVSEILDDSLAHYGIKGQKWGEQNGPPYPLDKKTHNQVTKSYNQNTKTGDVDPGLVKAGVMVGAYAATLSGLYIWAKKFTRKKQNKFSDANIEISKDLIGDIANVGKRFSINNLPKKIEGDHSEAQDMAAVNPKYYNGSVQSTSSNCTLCAFAYDMRRRGYDVTANCSAGSGNYPDVLMKDIYVGAKNRSIPAFTFDGVYKKIAKKFPENARGEIAAYSSNGGGHSMVFEVKNGKTIVRCPQTNTVVTPTMLTKWGFDPSKCLVIRTDNLPVRMENLHVICSELKPGWKQVVAKEQTLRQKQIKTINAQKKTAAGRDLMTENEKKKSLEKQWKREHKGRVMDAEAREAMDNWVKGNMWSAPWQYGQNSLQHYGTKGMHWGVRNYQNPDGTLTKAGRLRYRKKDGNSESKNQKHSDTGSIKRPDGSKWKSSEAKKLSDKELNDRNSRLQRERQYKDLTTPQWKKTSKEINKEALKKIFVGTGVGIGVVAMRKAYPLLVQKGAQFILTHFGSHAVKWVL